MTTVEKEINERAIRVNDHVAGFQIDHPPHTPGAVLRGRPA
jgi:hypothetical protein